MRTRKVLRSPLAILGGLIALYLALPLGVFVVHFATSSQRGFHQAGLFSALWLSCTSATISLVLITLFGVPLAYLLARSKGRLSTVIGVVVQIPLALPPLMSGIVLIYLVGPYTLLGKTFDRQLTNSRAGVIIAMTFVAAPFLIVTARSAFEALDQGLLDVAQTLGHSDLSRFLRVAVPIASPGIRAGMLLSWLRAFGEYGAVVVLAYYPSSLPVYTYNQFSGVGLSSTLAPTALAMGVALLAVIVSRTRFRRRQHPAAVPSPTAVLNVSVGEAIRFEVDHQVGGFRLRLNETSRVHHLAVLGASGSGKSMLLRSLAGLNGERAGQLWCGDETLSDQPVEQRGVGYVAQGFSLFPHLTVWQHLLFARNATPALATYWLDHLELRGLETKRPSELSGGQRQRVALAQVLTSSPRVLLLDEPFSALDVPVRQELRRLLRRLQRETGLSTVLVTHDPEEAGFLADDVLVLDGGASLQSGTSRDVFSHPDSTKVARLLGISNVLAAVVTGPDVIECAGVAVSARTTGLSPGAMVSWSIRPERITIEHRPGLELRNRFSSTLTGRIVDCAFVGTAVDLLVAIAPGFELQVRASSEERFSIGDPCPIALHADAITLWPAVPMRAEFAQVSQ